MHQQHLAGREIGQEIFGAAPETGDGLPFKARSEVARQRPAQVAAPRLDRREARPLHDRLEAAPHRLHLRKLGH